MILRCPAALEDEELVKRYSLNIVGCGKVGRTLGRLGALSGAWQVRCVLNRSLPSAVQAVRFIGSGRPIESLSQMEPAELVMISAADEAIPECGRQLAETGLLGEGTIVFHCSGALPSAVLEPARRPGVSIASLHPIKSFADPAAAVESFAGTFCALEGDRRACEVLGDVFRRLGAVPLAIDARQKTLYHAGTVMVCNYLVALVESGLRCFEKSGIGRDTAMRVLAPLVRETVDNIFALGPVRALTGPIARGDASVVAQQHDALGQWDETIRLVYRALGLVALELSAAQGRASGEALETIRNLLRR